MSKPGRPPLPYIRDTWKVSLPAPLTAEIDLMLSNPATHRLKYGARSRLVEALLRRWLAEVRGEPPNTVPGVDDLKEP